MKKPGIALFGMALVACGGTGESETSRTTMIDSPATTPTSTPFRPGIRFDAATLRPGTRVGNLVADSVTARRTVVDSTYVGMARFLGRIELSGATLRNPDADLKDVASCFEVDSASAARLPRWSGDERRPWFCFVNPADSKRALGAPSEGVPATIVIDSFTIYRGLSDEVNSARFVSRVR